MAASGQNLVYEDIGERRVYHATNRQAALGIMGEQTMRPGQSGMFGGGIYFALTRDIALEKARHVGEADAMIVTAMVDFGRAVVLTSPMPDLTPAALEAMGADSVKGQSAPGKNWEFVVFDRARIRLIQFENSPRDPDTPAPSRFSDTFLKGMGVIASAAGAVAGFAVALDRLNRRH
jgi:hypothetical protein